MEYCRIVEAPQLIFYNLQCVYKVDIDFEAPQARKFRQFAASIRDFTSILDVFCLKIVDF